MKLLFIGDIVGRPGRDLVRRHVRALAARHGAALVIANGENAAGGAGITRENMLEILSAGVDVITTGNHVWDKRETLEVIGGEPRLLRPANYPEGAPGAGAYVATAGNGVRVGVINVMGRVLMNAIGTVPRKLGSKARGRPCRPRTTDQHTEPRVPHSNTHTPCERKTSQGASAMAHRWREARVPHERTGNTMFRHK
jgi:hypothetical protein